MLLIDETTGIRRGKEYMGSEDDFRRQYRMRDSKMDFRGGWGTYYLEVPLTVDLTKMRKSPHFPDI